jgi:hypothetical protein
MLAYRIAFDQKISIMAFGAELEGPRGGHEFDGSRPAEVAEYKAIGEGILAPCTQGTDHKMETNRRDEEIRGKCIVIVF